MDKLILIDGNSLVYRAFYGSAYSSTGIMTNSAGQPTNAVLVFTRMISKIIDNYSPDYLFIAFDAGKKTKRHDLLSSYKGNRQKTPDELISQFPIIKKMLTLMNIKWYEKEGIEADDIIGSLANKYSPDFDVSIFSSDKDMYQLVDKNVKIVVPQNGQKPDVIVEQDKFLDNLGYNPYQVPDIKGLVGDASDNLPGVSGIGPKTAVKLISQYVTLENIYKNIEEIKGSQKEKLLKDEKIAFLCKKLATIDKFVDIPFSIDSMSAKIKVSNDLISLFDSLELRSLKRLFSLKLEEFKKPYENLLF